ncbi:MAG: sigma 54-interacting transcriptional regulator [Clostridiales Family XIII bacterium]|jgi:PAS domain S-box-containing protein|nr:sigma 54-interacting transcriptional regulator [Clostridiales Family XIII bacterium]
MSYSIHQLKEIELLNTILNALPDGILLADEAGKVIYVNQSYCRIVKVNYVDMIDRNVTESRPGTRLPEVLKTGKGLHGIRRKVGSVEYITDITPIIIDGKTIGAISTVKDITSVIMLSKLVTDYSTQVEKIKKVIKKTYQAKYSINDIIGVSHEIETLKNLCGFVADGDLPVLITGESGTGKELFAHAIHNMSYRANEPFVAVNCAAFSHTLLLSELFGYEKGAFTGAASEGKIGLFEVAHKGTLFLDEIGDMDYALQPQILRVLETGEFMRVGGNTPVEVDVRVIAATNKNLTPMISEGKFREDLYYRLNIVALNIPPLRERKEDIVPIAQYILSNISKKYRRALSFDNTAIAKLEGYQFPGNVREMVNVISLSVGLSANNLITASDLIMREATLPYAKNEVLGMISQNPDYPKRNISSNDKEAVEYALLLYGNSVSGKKEAAGYLGISLATLYNRIREFGIVTK